jgi:hypothetical protein
MPEFMEIRRVLLGPQHLQPAEVGATIHAGGVMEPKAPFAELRIARYVGEESCYILHIARNGKSTDTWYETLTAALREAEDLYGVKDTDWLVVNVPFGADEDS